MLFLVLIKIGDFYPNPSHQLINKKVKTTEKIQKLIAYQLKLFLAG